MKKFNSNYFLLSVFILLAILNFFNLVLIDWWLIIIAILITLFMPSGNEDFIRDNFQNIYDSNKVISDKFRKTKKRLESIDDTIDSLREYHNKEIESKNQEILALYLEISNLRKELNIYNEEDDKNIETKIKKYL